MRMTTVITLYVTVQCVHVCLVDKCVVSSWIERVKSGETFTCSGTKDLFNFWLYVTRCADTNETKLVFYSTYVSELSHCERPFAMS